MGPTPAWATRRSYWPGVRVAHLGHWYLWVPYAIPVLIVLAASLRAFRQQRAENRENERASDRSR